MRLQDELDRRLGVRPKLRVGIMGQLDVFVDGELVFSRKQAGRYPTAEEIVDAVENM